MTILRSLRTPRRLTLIALNFLLLGLLLKWTINPPQALIPAAQAIDLATLFSEKLGPPSVVDTNLGDTYALLISQPLFQSDRKYTPPPKSDATVVQSPPPDFALTGYLDIPGRPAKAFLHERSGTRTLTVAMGDGLDGWSIVGLNPKRVILRQGDRTAELTRGGPSIAGVSPIADSASTGSTAHQQTPLAQQPLASAPPPTPASNVVAPTTNSASPPLGAAESNKTPVARPIGPSHVSMTATLSAVTVTAQRLILGPPPLPAPQGPPRTFSSPPQPASN